MPEGGSVADDAEQSDTQEYQTAEQGQDGQEGQQAPESTDPITASFTTAPERHDGSSAFQVRVEFSEDINTSYKDLPDAFTVTNGATSAAQRVNGIGSLWELDVTPTGDDRVILTLAGS